VLAEGEGGGGPGARRYAQAKVGAKADALRVPGETINFAELRETLRTDWLVRQALRFSANLILSLIGEYEHEDPRVVEFVRGAIGYMRRSWRSALLAQLEAIWYGFSMAEIVWEAGAGLNGGRRGASPPRGGGGGASASRGGGGAWLIRYLAPLDPARFYPAGFDMQKGLDQTEARMGAGTMEETLIPSSHFVHWAYESADNPYGNPLAPTVWLNVKGRDHASRLWLTGLEHRGQPLLYEVVPHSVYKDPDTGLETTAVEQAQKSWDGTQGGSVVIRSAADGEGKLPRVEVMDLSGWTTEFTDFFAYKDKAILLGFGIPPMVLLEPEHATRAQAAVQSELTKLTFVPTAEEFAQSVLVDQIVDPLIRYNLGEQDDYGHFPVSMPVDQEGLAGILESLERVGVFTAMAPSLYATIQEKFPGILPTPEEREADGEWGALPAGVEGGA
jgi:hypothetical protein